MSDDCGAALGNGSNELYAIKVGFVDFETFEVQASRILHAATCTEII